MTKKKRSTSAGNRVSLRDRNRAAIAEPQAPAPPDETPAPTPVPAPPEETEVQGAGRLGIYLTGAMFQDAKAAYLADWYNGGQADTFAAWIAAAVETHAARTPAQRADHQQTQRPRGGGVTRSFLVPAATLVALRAAIDADRAAGRWLSDSAWCAEALDLAITRARTHNGGTLPTPPARLPNRLTR